MDDHALAAVGDARRTDTVPVPTARQVLVRALPAAAIVAFALPPAVWWMLDPFGEIRTPWWPLVLAVLFGVPVLVHYFARARRPRRDKRVNPQRVKSVLEMPAQPEVVPENSAVRTAAGVTACDRIEAAVSSGGSAVAVLILMLTRDELVWTSLTVVFGLSTVLHVVRARRPWAYLRAWHSANRAG